MATPTNPLAELRAALVHALELDAKAAPGPWTHDDPHGNCRIESPDPYGFRETGEKSLIIYDEGGHDEDDAAFICDARTGYPRLARVMEAMLDRAESIAQDVGHTAPLTAAEILEAAAAAWSGGKDGP